jgi:alkylation response protein AidB-like acyl-CoA dehydrogenase
MEPTVVTIGRMRVELTEEQGFLQESIAGALAREAPPAAIRRWAEARDSAPAYALAGRQGWTGIGLEDDLGGQGGATVELAIMAEQFGRAALPWDLLLGGCLGLPLLRTAAVDQAGPASEHNADAMRAAGDLAAATALGERAAILCLDGRRLPAPWPEHVLSDDSCTLTADYVPGAVDASELLIVVQTVAGMRLVAVKTDAPGATISPRPIVDHTRSLGLVQLQAAPAIDLGTISVEAMNTAAAAAAVLVSADALGAASQMLEATVEYVGERKQFGVPVGSFQAVKHAAAQMLVDVEASRSAVRYASWAVDASADELKWGSIAKAHVCSAALRVADKALFLHGAIGYTWEHDLQFQFKRAKSDAPLFGSAESHQDALAARLALAGS